MLLYAALYGMDNAQSTHPHSSIVPFVRGAVAASAAGAAIHPLLTLKNRAQQNKPFTLNPKVLTKGMSTTITSMAPITSVQMGMFDCFKRGQAPQDEDGWHKALHGAIAGGSSSPLSCVSEHGLVMQQEKKCSWWQAIKYVRSSGTKYGVFLGWTPMAGREVGFATLYFGGGDIIKQYTGMNEALSNMSAGVIAAILTHPFDTIKVEMHTHQLTMLQALQGILKDPQKSLAKGLAPRALGVMPGAFLVMKEVEQWFNHLVLHEGKSS